MKITVIRSYGAGVPDQTEVRFFEGKRADKDSIEYLSQIDKEKMDIACMKALGKKYKPTLIYNKKSRPKLEYYNVVREIPYKLSVTIEHQ